jgi:hypothetical protein
VSDRTGLDSFDVWQWLPGGFHERVGQGLDARSAVELAHSYTTRPAARIGVIQKVAIVDAEDFTVFQWERDKGVTFK